MNKMPVNAGGIKALRIMYFAMLGGTLLLSAIIYFTSQDVEPPLAEWKRNILIISLFAAVIALSASAFMWRKDLSNIQQGDMSLEQKFNQYRAASIKRYAFTEFAALFSVICYYLSGEGKLYIVVAVLIAHFCTLYPSSSKIAAQTGENAEDIEKL